MATWLLTGAGRPLALASLSALAARSARWPSTLTGWDGASHILLGLLLALALLTFADYGITWDEPRQQEYGERALRYYATLGADRSAFEYFDLYLYGAAFDLAVAFLQQISPLEPYATRHLVNALVGVFGLIAVWKLARELVTPRAGFLALLLLAVSPDWYGHMFNNPKDIPFATAMTWGTLLAVRVARGLPGLGACTVLAFGLAAGVALGSRVAGGLLFVYLAALVALWVGSEARRRGPGAAAREGLRVSLGLLPAVLTAGVIMLALWPWAQLDPIGNPLHAVRVFSHFPHDTTFVYAGEVVHSTDLPWHYLPVMLLVRLPEPTLLGLLALPLLLARPAHHPTAAVPPHAWAVLATAAVLPVVLVLATGAVLYDGLRHVLFVLPLITVAAAGALDRLWERLRGPGVRTVVTGLGVAWLAFQGSQLARLHPYESILYNHVGGGASGAAGRFELDFWGNSLKDTTESLLDAVVLIAGDEALAQPMRLIVCGPFDSVRPFAPPAWQVLDSRTAQEGDLFVALAKMPCRPRGTPRVLVRTVREGVVLSSAGTLRDLTP